MLKKVFLDLADPVKRALWSAGQQFIIIAFAGMPLVSLGQLAGNVPWVAALGTAAFAFVASLITSGLTWRVPVLPFWLDWGARVVKTFLQSLAALFGATALNMFDANFRTQLVLALGVAGLAVVKGGLVLEALGHLGVSAAATTQTPAALAKLIAGDADDMGVGYGGDDDKGAVPTDISPADQTAVQPAYSGQGTELSSEPVEVAQHAAPEDSPGT